MSGSSDFSRESFKSMGSKSKSSRGMGNSRSQMQLGIHNNPKPSMMNKPSPGTLGDEEITKKLVPMSRLRYIFENEAVWVRKVKSKLIRWARALYYFIHTQKFGRASSRMSSRLTSR